jgi:membrane-bound transcription factor site-1 protease
VIKEAKFFDENTRKWWSPSTGGANLPALNNLLSKFDILLSDKIYEGEYKIGDHVALYSSGTSIIRFPKSNKNYLLQRELKDEGEEFLADAANRTSKSIFETIPIIGLTQTNINGDESKSGRIIVYGDSNCIDSSHLKKGIIFSNLFINKFKYMLNAFSM